MTSKRGLFKNAKAFWSWRGSISQNSVARQSAVIELLNENDAVTMKWTLANAWPTKVSGTDLNAEGDEVAVDSLELAYESVELANG